MSIQTGSLSPMLESIQVPLLNDLCQSLRATIDFAAARSNIQSIAITSPSPQEGKTTIIVQLAIAYALAGKKVLIVDANLRRPNLHTLFNQQRREGLADYLGLTIPLDDVIRPSGISNLDLVTSGSMVSHSTQLMSSDRLLDLFREASTRYDRVLADTSSMLELADAQLVASACDGVLLVAEHSKTRRDQLQKSSKMIMQLDKPLLGTVLNKQR
ncbi:CpsD/CapB family tyrosine-protein kinase [Paenibacillus herberti]|uniref:non-specific protein-tyrosine kinase n=1 Tax=Paenibacillus herberti TaxID=1619309 RepID=A0A229NV61_9BACL|nr:CpsD/CapB family tyrosine-protein kinase [Paenibacillus herberti]OXM13714.1 hypothetical protein CGZ75_22105 [Paenibacillus herberti]